MLKDKLTFIQCVLFLQMLVDGATLYTRTQVLNITTHDDQELLVLLRLMTAEFEIGPTYPDKLVRMIYQHYGVAIPSNIIHDFKLRATQARQEWLVEQAGYKELSRQAMSA